MSPQSWFVIGIATWALVEALLERRRRKQDKYWSVNIDAKPKRWSLRWPF